MGNRGQYRNIKHKTPEAKKKYLQHQRFLRENSINNKLKKQFNDEKEYEDLLADACDFDADIMASASGKFSQLVYKSQHESNMRLGRN